MLQSLDMDWHESNAPVDSADSAKLRKVAMAESDVRADDAHRSMTAVEMKTLLAYVSQDLELPHAPVFLKATHPLIQRVMLEQFHATHAEVQLTVDVTPAAKLRRNMTHTAIMAQLYAANADSPRGRQMLNRIMEDVKMLHFDGIHTLKFVFNSRRIAKIYMGLALRLNGTCIELEDSSSGETGLTYRPARLRRQYAIRVYGAEELGFVVLMTALGKLPGVNIVDAERPRVDTTEVIDNRYFQLRFSGETCPSELRNITKLEIQGHLVTLHHHVVHQRAPCGRCFAPFHTTGYCKTSPIHLDRKREKYKRTYHGPVAAYQVGTATQYKHNDGDSLATFISAMQRELVGQGLTSSGETEETAAALVSTTLSADTPNQYGPARATATTAPTSTHQTVADGGLARGHVEEDGFRTIDHRASRARHPRTGRTEMHPTENSETTHRSDAAAAPAAGSTRAPETVAAGRAGAAGSTVNAPASRNGGRKKITQNSKKSTKPTHRLF
ncbi:hypothetical protein PF002_g11316 [Phytophthora fragariae]|nr:hypothetical protein PF009_g14366 [Phytophthora fragariae]KAE9236142.1 hypothetical protein PF002_g11316 [Phytophthora fragariae]